MTLRKVISIFIIILAASGAGRILPQLHGQAAYKTPYWGHWKTGAKKKDKKGKGAAARTGKPATNAAKTSTGKAERQRPGK